jgi:hypothetical protein
VRQLCERLAATAGNGATVLARGWPVHDPRTAALLNGIAGRAIELCEGLRLVTGQPAMQTLPGILAVGEHAGTSGREMLTALLVGYDVAARLSMAFTPRPLAHQNGQVGLLAAAAAGASLAGARRSRREPCDAHRRDARAHAELHQRGGGRDALNIAGGMSGYVRPRAELALAGFEAQDDAIEEALTNLVGDGFHPTPAG